MTLSRCLGLVLLMGTACRAESVPEPPTTASEDTAAEAPERVLIGGIRWYVDYEAALAVAREQDKALWVHFGENPG